MFFRPFLFAKQSGGDQKGINREKGNKAGPEVQKRGFPGERAESGEHQKPGDAGEADQIEENGQAEFRPLPLLVGKHLTRSEDDGEIGKNLKAGTGEETDGPTEADFGKKAEGEADQGPEDADDGKQDHVAVFVAEGLIGFS